MAGLLDFLQTGDSGGGLLDLLRRSALQQQFSSGLPSDQAQYDAPILAPAAPIQNIVGNNQPSPLDTAQYPAGPIGAPSNAMAQAPQSQLPVNAQATQGQLPQPMQPTAPSGPGFGDRLAAGLQSWANTTPGNIIGGLANGIAGFSSGQRSDPAGLKQEQLRSSFNALVAGGVPPAQALAAVQSGNNDILKYTMDKYGKTEKFRPATAAEREAAGLKEGQPMFINTTTNEPKFGPAGTNVSTTIQSGEKSYDVDQGKEYSQAFSTMQKAGRDAFGAIGNLNKMSKLIEDPNFYSGTGGESVTSLKRAAVALGINDANTAAPNELFQKIAKKTVLDAAGGSLGTGFSNADRSFLEGTVPNVENTREGNRQIIQIAQKVQQRNIEVARMAREYAKSHGGRIDLGFDEQLSQYAAQNPLFPASDTPAAPAAPSVPGAKQAPDGKFYVPDPNRPGKYLQVVQ